MVKSKAVKAPLDDNLQRNWGWLLALGIVFVILGCIGLGMTILLTAVSMYFFGALLVVGGVSQIIDSFKCHKWKGILWHLVIGLLYIGCGAVVIYDPFLVSAFLTMFLGAMLIVIGIARFVMAFVLKNAKGWGFLLLAGLSAFVLGLLILMQWPYSGLWVIGLFIAIELIINGWTNIFIALSIRKA